MSRLTDRSGGYYLADLAREVGPAPVRPGRWTGSGAAGLGLTGPVDGRELAAVLAGRAPATGRSLVGRRGPVSGFDLTFAAPKSASVLFALGPPGVADAVRSAHEEAVAATMGYVAARSAAVRRGSGGDRRPVEVAGLVGAAFTHGVSRALDPHLHTHVVVANLGQGPDGRWTALDGRGLFAHAAACGALYDAHLRHRLASDLGVEWSVRRSGHHEVVGIAPEVLGGFSARRAEIRAHLAGAGRRTGTTVPGGRSSAADRVAWAATRDPKVATSDPSVVSRRWSDRARALGFAPGHLRPVPGRPGRRTEVIDEHRFRARLVLSQSDGVCRRDAVGGWAAALDSGAPAADVERCVDLLVGWGAGVGVGEIRQPSSAVVPARHLLGELGPRPASPAALGTWLEASADVARYRARWGVTDPVLALGPDGAHLASLGARQLADRLATAQRLAETRRALGREVVREGERPERALGR